MTPQDMAAWLADEHRTVELLLDGVAQLVAAPPRTELAGWLGNVRMQIDDLRRHCCDHFEMEERDGYLLPVLERRPTLSKNVAQLRHEHEQLGRLMDSIREELDRISAADSLLIRDVSERIRRFVGYVREHERHENSLVSAVLSQDEGTKD